MRKIGKLKWFSAEKGFGFVEVEGHGDVLLHRTILSGFGATSVSEGATIECEVVRRGKLSHASLIYRIVEPETPAATRPKRPALLNGRRRPIARAAAPITLGEPGPARLAVCRWFSRAKGYGFLRPLGADNDILRPGESESDIFVHMDVMRREGLRELKAGDAVLVRVVNGPKGATAARLRPAPRMPAVMWPLKRLDAPAPGESCSGVIGTLLFSDGARGFAVLSLPELDDVAFCELALLSEAGVSEADIAAANGGQPGVVLICDVECEPPLLVITKVSRPN